MRLIDADALSKHKFLTLQVKVIGGRRNGKVNEQLVDAYRQGWNDAIDAIIDNALTVDAIPNKEGYEMYNKGYMSGYERGKEERPHGEWELVHPLQENDTGDYKCSVCGWGGFVIKPTNYCPYCGAEMRVKDELKGEKE